MKKSLWLLPNLLAAAALILAACAPAATAVPTVAATSAPQATEAPSVEPVTITIWHQWDGAYQAPIEAAFAEYMSLHPNVTIDISKPDDVSNALSVAIPAGEGPDIIGWANDKIGEQALAGNIVPLNDLGVDQAFIESIYEPAAIRGVVWKDQIWALPETQEGIALVYNKAILGEGDLPTDLNDLLAKAQAYAEANSGKFLVCNQGFGGADAYHVAPVYFGFGVPEYVDDAGKAYLNTPEALEAGNWLAEMSKVSPTENSDQIAGALFSEGTCAMRWTGPWAIAGMEAEGIDYGILPMGSPFVGIKTMMITKNAVDRGHADIALDIIKYYTSAEVQTTLALTNKTIPAQTAALADPEVAALETLVGFGAALNSGVPMANTPFAGAQWVPVGDASVAIWTGAQTPEEALNAAQTAIEEAISQMQ